MSATDELGRLRPLPRQRVTAEMVRGVLIWARNYGEIESYKMISPGRKWLIRLPRPLVVGSGLVVGEAGPQDVMPSELVLSSREALAFGYGCVAGGENPGGRAAKQKEWDW